MLAEVERDQNGGGPGFDPNSLAGTFTVALVLCLVCSLVVSTTAIMLRPLQEVNRQNKMRRNVLVAADIWDSSVHRDSDIPSLFESIDILYVNLPRSDEEAGTINETIDPETYDQQRAATDPTQSVLIPPELDLAGITRRERVSLAFVVRDEQGALESVVLPIYGVGLWSTMYGYLSLEQDLRTIRGITFYRHGETPGMGGEIDNPRWKAQWPGKSATNEAGVPVLRITKPGSAQASHEIDGISGSTITSVGVQQTVNYWLGEDAFKPFLDRLRDGEL